MCALRRERGGSRFPRLLPYRRLSQEATVAGAGPRSGGAEELTVTPDDEGMTTPVGLGPPTADEVERDRLRVLKEAEWARAVEEGEAARAKTRERAAEEARRAAAMAAAHRARILAEERRAMAASTGVILRPTGEARRAMKNALLCALPGVLLLGGAISAVGNGAVIGAIVLSVMSAVFFLNSWYQWWVGLVGFVADQIGDAVAKRMTTQPPPATAEPAPKHGVGG